MVVLVGGYTYLKIQSSSIARSLLTDLFNKNDTRNLDIPSLDLTFSLWNQTIEVADVRISSVDSVSSRFGLDVTIERFRFRLKSVLDLLIDKKLEVESMEIIHPEVFIRSAKTTNKKSNKSGFSFETGSLYEEIQEYVRTLQIDDFRLSHGSISYERQQSDFIPIGIADVSLKISQFLMDSASVVRQDQVFFTESIMIELKDQEFMLPDSIHVLAFDRFRISTRDRLIAFENVTLRPGRDLLSPQDSIERYDMEVPGITLRGVDFVKAYNQRQLAVAFMSLDQPVIRHQGTQVVKRSKGTPETSNPLMKTFTKIFNEIEVDTFQVSRAGVEVISGFDEEVRINDISLALYGFRVDSATYRFGEELEYFDELVLEINNYETFLADRFQVGFGRLYLDSRLSEFEISAGFLKTTSTGNDAIDIKLPFLHSTGSNYREAWNSGKLEIGSIELESPSVTWSSEGGKQKQEKDSTNLIDEFLKEVHLTSLNITKADIQLVKDSLSVTARGTDFMLEDVLLYQQDQDQSLVRALLDHSSVAIEQLHVEQGQTIDFVQLQYDGPAGNIFFANATVLEDTTARIFVDSVALTGWDRSVDVAESGIHFDSLLINGAAISLHAGVSKKERGNPLRTLQRSAFQFLDVRDIDVDYFIGGAKKYGVRGFDLLVDQFYYDTQADEFQAMVSIGLDSVALDLDSLYHRFLATEIYLSNEDSIIHFSSLSLTPYEATQQNRISFEGQELEFDQFDWNALANKGQAFFRNGYIQDPKIDISWNVQGDNDRNQEDTLDFRDNFRFDQFLIDEADIKLALISSTDTLRVESEYLTFGLEKFNQFRDPSEHLFYTRNITLDLYQTSVSSTLLEEQVQIDSLVIKTAANQFELVGLTLQKKGKFDIQLDRLTLEALDFKTLRRGNGLMAERLHLEAPQAFYSAMEDNQAPEAASKKPFKLFSSQFPRLDIAQFSIRDGRFDIAQNKIALGDTLHLRDFDLSVGPIKLDSNTTARNYDLSEAYIDLHAGKMYLELNDSLSFVGWDDLSFEDASKKLTLLKPKYGHKYSPEEFTRHIEVQKTWVSTAADSVVIEGIGWEEMIRSSTYQVDLLRVHGLDLYADRDKRVVFDSTQRKELPSISLMALPKEISIDSVEVFNADVTYTQMPEKSGETGTLQITDINARLGNVTNIASKIQDDPKMRFSANGKLTGTGLFTMDVAFDLDQGLGTYSMNGRVGSMDLTRLNNFMEPVALVQIQSGMCKYIEYDFVADTEKAVGKLRFYYKDLRLNILKQNEAQTRYKNRAFLTFFANAFVVQHKNPKFLSAKRKDIFYERDPQRGILDYWSKSILSGVAGSVGALNTKKQLKQFNAQSAQQVSSIE